MVCELHRNTRSGKSPFHSLGQKMQGPWRCGHSVTGNHIPQNSTKNLDKEPFERGDTRCFLLGTCIHLSQGINFSHAHVSTVYQTLSRLQGLESDKEMGVPVPRERMEIRQENRLWEQELGMPWAGRGAPEVSSKGAQRRAESHLVVWSWGQGNEMLRGQRWTWKDGEHP